MAASEQPSGHQDVLGWSKIDGKRISGRLQPKLGESVRTTDIFLI